MFAAFAALTAPRLGLLPGLAFAAVQSAAHGGIDLWKIRRSRIPPVTSLSGRSPAASPGTMVIP